MEAAWPLGARMGCPPPLGCAEQMSSCPAAQVPGWGLPLLGPPQGRFPGARLSQLLPAQGTPSSAAGLRIPKPDAHFTDPPRAGHTWKHRWPADGSAWSPRCGGRLGPGLSGPCSGGPGGRRGLPGVHCAPSPGPRVSRRHCQGPGGPCPHSRPHQPALRGLCRERRRQLWKEPGLHGPNTVPCWAPGLQWAWSRPAPQGWGAPFFPLERPCH